jgi:hypothetical protein
MNFIEKPKETFNKVRFLDYYMEGHAGFIAGGSFKNIFKKEKIKDLDIFFQSEKDFQDAKVFFETNEDYVFSYENQNTVSFKNKKTNIRVELIRHTYGTPIEIISMFDFSITRYAYAKKTEAEGIVYYNVYVDCFFEDLINNKLVIDGELKFPISSFERSYRYRSYGYGLCKESKAKLLEALQTANIDDLSNDLYFGLD